LFRDRSTGSHSWDSGFDRGTHWRRTNLPQPTAEEIEAKEINDAWDTDHEFNSFKAGWIAHKSKTAKP